jgi:hypothetical protein
MVARARDLRKQGIAAEVRLMPLRLSQTDTPATASGFAVINDRVGLGEAREPNPGHERLIRRMMKNTSNTARRDLMFRKMAFVLAATAALGAVALSPTSASAWGHGHWGGHGWGGHGWGWGGFGVGVAAGLVGGAIVANTCLQRRIIDTPYGPAVRWVNVCY